MKRWMSFFGALDLGVVATYATRLPDHFRGLLTEPLLNGACLLIMASLAVSGVALLRGQCWAFWLNFAQFLARLLLAYLSFSWLAMLILPPHPSILFHEAVWGAAVALEGVRLGVTIMLHSQSADNCVPRPDMPQQQTVPA